MDPAAHGGFKTGDENRHAGGHADGAEQRGDGEAVAAGRRGQMAQRDAGDRGRFAGAAGHASDGGQEKSAEHAAAENPEKRRDVAGERETPAAGETQRRELRADDSGGDEGNAEPRAAQRAVAGSGAGGAHEDLGGRRPRGFAGGPPASEETRDETEEQAERDLTGVEPGGLDGGGVVEGIDGLADGAHGKLGAGPTEQQPQSAAEQAEHGGLGKPRAADRALLDAERAEDGDFAAATDHGAVEGLENQIQADEERDEGEDGEVEAEGARHGRGGVAARAG